MGQAAKDFLEKYAIIFGVGLYVALTAAAWKFWPSSWPGGDLTSNLFAGSIDAVVIVLLVQYLIDRNEQRKSRPVRLAAFKETRALFDKYYNFWYQMIKAASNYEPLDSR